MTVFGAMPDGTPVHVIPLKGARLQAQILTHGARLHGLSLDGSRNLMVGSPDLAGYLGDAQYAGPVVGPVVNRIAGAQADLDGKTYRFEANQDGQHSLHSGTGTHSMVWEVVGADAGAVHLRLALPDGHGGFPGNRVIDATYRIEGLDLSLSLRAVTDAPTFMNLAHHGVWSMDGGDTWAGHRLWVDATHYLPTGDGKIPTGEVAEVKDTPFDHRALSAPDPGLDHNFCFEDDGKMRLLARLAGGSGRFVEVLSDAPGLQVYAGGSRGIALEPQMWPDAPHHPVFPSITLRPGETFLQETIFRFGAD